MKKIALGMSGGVDSSVCAQLLVEQGYEVTGVFLECWRAPGCRSEEDRQDALKVALDLGIPFQVLDFKDTYKNKVVENFFEEYEAGRTPNPDVLCNKEIKFGLFYDWAMENGFYAIATGHYAKIVNKDKKTEERKMLAIPKDEHKDQTYFLYLLNEDHLDHTVFPLANMTKDEVRTEAEKRNLHVAKKKDSVGICFIGDIDVSKFLKDRLGENPGEVIDTDGNVIGKHKGLWFYTTGQRHGFEINKKTVVRLNDGSSFTKENIPPFYVVGKQAEQNRLVVGFGKETYVDEFGVENLHWITRAPSDEEKKNLLVRIRHTGELLPCHLQFNGDKGIVSLAKPTKGIAEGQSAVFYVKKTNEVLCLGGGIMKSLVTQSQTV